VENAFPAKIEFCTSEPNRSAARLCGMDESFDPYYKWLGIPPAEQPPNHYRLLGVTLFESDLDVIANAADQRIGHVRAFQIGKHSDESQRILKAISAARVCLLNADKKAEYDAGLRSAADAAVNAEPRVVAVSSRGGMHRAPRKQKPTWLLAVCGSAVAVAVFAFAIGLLSSGDEDAGQTAARPPAVEPTPPVASKPLPAASVGDTEPPAEASPPQAEPPAAQDPSEPKPMVQPPPKESAAVPEPLPSEAQKPTPDKESAPPDAEPTSAAKPEPASQPPPALPETMPTTPADAETLEQAEQRLNADVVQASTATAQQAVAREALMLADKAILASQAELAKRLSVLALKGARKSNSDDLVNDATLLMNELSQPISDALRDKARQRLGQQ
jgi:hypothetical protein